MTRTTQRDKVAEKFLTIPLVCTVMGFELAALVAQLALVTCTEEHPVPTRPPLRRQPILLEGHLSQLGYPGLTNAQVGSVLFLVPMLQILGAARAEHLTECLKLYEVARSDLQAEIPLHANEPQEACPVSDRDRCPAGWCQAIEHRDWPCIPDLHGFGYIESQYVSQIIIRIAGVLDIDGYLIVSRIRVAEERAMHLPKTDDSRFLIVTVLILSGLQHLRRKGYAEGAIIEIYSWFRQKETAFLLYEATFSTTCRWHNGHRSPFGVFHDTRTK
jgi:hypothetical protein